MVIYEFSCKREIGKVNRYGSLSGYRYEKTVTCRFGFLEMNFNKVGIRDESVERFVEAPEPHKRFHREIGDDFND